MRLRLLAAALLSTTPLAAQDNARLQDMAQLLMLEDRREFDGAALQRASQHPDPRVRERAAMAIGRIGDPAGNPLLMRLLIDEDTTVRLEAVFAMGELGDRSVVPELATLVGQMPAADNSQFAVELVTALAKLGGPEAEAALVGILERHPATESSADRATPTVLMEAHRLPRTSSLATRLADYIRNGRAEWRRNATYSATRLPVWSTGSVLLDVVRDDDALTRQWAARGLTAVMADSSGVTRETFVAALRMLVSDRDAQVRINALRSLSTFADSSLSPVAAARLTDRDPGVAVEAANALGRLGGARAVQALREWFPGAPSVGHRRAAAVALARTDAAAALEMTRAWRGDPDWRLRAAFLEVAATARTPASRQLIEELLDDADPRVATQALGALAGQGQRPDSALIARALRLLSASDLHQRAGAIEVLGRARDPNLARDLTAAYRQALNDPENDARLAAVNALAELAQTPAGLAQGDALFLGSVSRSDDYLVRRLAARRFGDAAYRRTWGSLLPIETGRSIEEYRELAQRYLTGARFRASIETDRGTIMINLFAREAPLTVDNFLRLIDQRYFDNGRWHRVVPNFVIQDGDPRGDGSGGPGTVIRDEINRRRYSRGAVGMALSGPDTGGSQFFITHSPQPHLDGGYTVFGEVVAGWDVVDQMVQGDRIRRIYR